jgi:hypothetical protein
MKLAVGRFITGDAAGIVHVTNFAHCHQSISLPYIEVKLNHVRLGFVRFINVDNAVLKVASNTIETGERIDV